MRQIVNEIYHPAYALPTAQRRGLAGHGPKTLAKGAALAANWEWNLKVTVNE